MRQHFGNVFMGLLCKNAEVSARVKGQSAYSNNMNDLTNVFISQCVEQK